MENVHKEKRHGLTIKIYQDENTQSPEDWGDTNVFIIGRDTQNFWIEAPKGIKPEKEYWIFPLEAYIHSGICLALMNEGRFPDRQWDVSSNIGEVYVHKSEFKTKAQARKCARGTVELWNNYLSGNVFGFVVEDEEENHIDSCWGFFGDYDKEGGALLEARTSVDHMTNKGLTDHNGQILFDFMGVGA